MRARYLLHTYRVESLQDRDGRFGFGPTFLTWRAWVASHLPPYTIVGTLSVTFFVTTPRGPLLICTYGYVSTEIVYQLHSYWSDKSLTCDVIRP